MIPADDRNGRPTVAQMLKGYGWFNASQIAQAHDKDANEYVRRPSLLEYMDAVVEEMGIEWLVESSSDQLMVRVPDGEGRGVWLHPVLAVDFARWVAVDFAVFMDVRPTEPPPTASAKERAHYRWQLGEVQRWQRWFRDTFGERAQ